VQPANYASGTASTYIALQNGGQLFNQLLDVSIKLCGQPVQGAGEFGWAWDIVTKYMSSVETVSSAGLAEGFVPDVGPANVRADANTGYVARAQLIRATTAGQAAGAVRFTGKVNLPFLTGNKQLVYLRNAEDLTINVTLRRAGDPDCIEQDFSAAAFRWIENLTFKIDRYDLSDALNNLLLREIQVRPQVLIYPDMKVEHFQVAACTNNMTDISISNGKIDGLIVGYQATDAVNRRQFTQCHVASVQVKRKQTLYPTEAYQPNFTAKTLRQWMGAYFDFIHGAGDMLNSNGTIITPNLYSDSQVLYFFDLRKSNAGLPEKQEVTADGKSGDIVKITTKFTQQTAADMYVIILSTGKIKYSAKSNNAQMEYIQGCYL